MASLRPRNLPLFFPLHRYYWLTMLIILIFKGGTASTEGERGPLFFRGVQAFSPALPTRRSLYHTIHLPSATKSVRTAATVDKHEDQETMEDQNQDAFQDEEQVGYQVPDDPLQRHVLMLISVTLPWYAFTAYEMITRASSSDFLGLPPLLVSILGVYVVASQLAVYYLCTRLAQTTTLAKAQTLVGIMTCLCIPADVLGTLYEPTGSLGVTVVAFATATTAFGIFLAHYLRKAAYREMPPTNDQHIENEEEHSFDEEESVWAVLQAYRPPPQPSSTKLAMDFTRAFVTFTISVSALGTFFAEGHEPNVWIVASLVSVF